MGGWEGLTTEHHLRTLGNPKPFTLLPDMSGVRGLSRLLRPLHRLDVLGCGVDGQIGLGSRRLKTLFQRSMSARNESTAVWGTYLAGVLYLFFGIACRR